MKITNADTAKAQSKQALGMATGWVRVEFLYAWTRPASLNPLSEPVPFNKRVFFQLQTHPVVPRELHGPHSILPSLKSYTNTNTYIKNTSFRSMNFPFIITNTNTNPNTNTNTDFINTKISDFPF